MGPDTNSLCRNTSEVDPTLIIRQEYDGYWPIDGGDGKHYGGGTLKSA